MTTISQTQFQNLISSAAKLLPTKTALKQARFVMKEKKFVAGKGRIWVENIPQVFQGVTIEAHAAGFISASVHVLDQNREAVISLPFTVKAQVDKPFRLMVYAEPLLALVKLSPKQETLSLSLTDEQKLEMRAGHSIDRFKPITDDWMQNLPQPETKPETPTAPLMLPAPACSICNLHNVKLADYNGHWVCEVCQSRVQAYERKVEARIDRLQNRADKAAEESQAGWNRAHQMAEVIPFGQPILVGHHSERRDRNYRERIWNTQKRAYENGQKAEELARRAHAAEKNHAISSDDPAAVLKLEEKIASCKKAQETMVAVNKAVRKLVPAIERGKSYVDLAPQLIEMTGCSQKIATTVLTPDFFGRLGFADYATRNNGAEIRRLQKRIDELKAKQAAPTIEAEDETYGDLRIERDTDENRLRLIFPCKPSPQIINQLKRNGFHWSPSNRAWQRQLNNAAEYALTQVKDFIQKQQPASISFPI